MKKEKVRSLELYFPLSESQIKEISRKIRIKKMEKIKCSYVVPEFNNIKSVIQTSYDIVRALSAELTVDSLLGKSTLFTIVLPIESL